MSLKSFYEYYFNQIKYLVLIILITLSIIVFFNSNNINYFYFIAIPLITSSFFIWFIFFLPEKIKIFFKLEEKPINIFLLGMLFGIISIIPFFLYLSMLIFKNGSNEGWAFLGFILLGMSAILILIINYFIALTWFLFNKYKKINFKENK